MTLSALAAELLVKNGKLKWQYLRLTRHYEWNDFEGPGEPFSGGGAALARSAGGVVKGIGGVPVRWAKSLKKHEKIHEQKGRSPSSIALKANKSGAKPMIPRNRKATDSQVNEGQAVLDEGALDTPESGQQGEDSKLPETSTLPSGSSEPKNGESANRDIVGPLMISNDNDDTSSMSIDGSEENIAQ